MSDNLTPQEKIKKQKDETLQKWIGLGLVSLGLIGFLFEALFGKACHIPDNGGVPSASVLFVMVGMAFYFPDLLQGPDGGFSTMRMIVFMIILVFVMLTVKIGWQTTSFDEFRIDNTWIYIVGLAFGGKVFQTFGEKSAQDDSSGDDSSEGKDDQQGNGK
jgi:hypothetical protein